MHRGWAGDGQATREVNSYVGVARSKKHYSLGSRSIKYLHKNPIFNLTF